MRKILFWLALLFSVPASAGVVYNWQTIEPDGVTPALTGRIEIANEAWRSGSLDHSYKPTCPDYWTADCPDLPWRPLDMSDPASPVLTLSLGGGVFIDGPLDIDYRAGTGLFSWLQEGDSTFALSFAALMDGSLSAFSGAVFVSMSSANGLWTITGYGYDWGPICTPEGWGKSPWCQQVTGLWVLDLSTIPVPLPGSVPLAAIGLVGLIAVTRRSASRKEVRSARPH